MFTITINTGPHAGARFELEDSCTHLIGRGDACSVRLDDPSISRVHCRLVLSSGSVLLEDAGSRWGTQVNGMPVESKELVPGDVIVIGDSELLLEEVSPARTTVTPQRKRMLAAQTAMPRAPEDPGQRSAGTAGDAVPKPVKLNKLVGDTFLRFRVGAPVSQSRSGTTFRAFDPRYKRHVALKVFWPEFFADEKQMRRFLRAIRTTLPIEHENLVKLHAAGRWRGLCFTASEFVEGESATQLIQRVGVAGMLDWRRVWRIGVGLAQALEFAHERNIVHRNLRPSNILIGAEDKVVKLGDLMLAKALDEMEAERITSPGEIVGDLCYLAPEQLSGDGHIDGRADIYSLGAALYALLTGHPPFTGAPGELIARVLSEPPVPPTKHHLSIPAAFEGIVLRMLAKRPDDRFTSATHFLKELRRVGKYQNVA